MKNLIKIGFSIILLLLFTSFLMDSSSLKIDSNNILSNKEIVNLNTTKDCLYYWGTISDIVQALGAIVLTVSVIIGLFGLRKQNRQRDDEVNSLKNQTEELSVQNNLIKENNKNLENIFLSFKNILLKDSKENYEILVLFEKQKRLNDIKPYFISHGGSTSGNVNVKHNLKNVGKRASNVHIEIICPDPKYRFLENKMSFVDNGGIFIFEYYNESRVFDKEIKLHLLFFDMDDNEYYQEITTYDIRRFIIKSPQLKKQNL
jgi:hypothetical protein